MQASLGPLGASVKTVPRVVPSTFAGLAPGLPPASPSEQFASSLVKLPPGIQHHDQKKISQAYDEPSYQIRYFIEI